MNADKAYELTAAERSAMQQINNNALSIKARAYDLRMQLDQCQAELVNLGNSFDMKLDALREAHGISGGGLTQDMSRLVGDAPPPVPPPPSITGPQGALGPVAVSRAEQP
jgi:hypothetical protein